MLYHLFLPLVLHLIQCKQTRLWKQLKMLGIGKVNIVGLVLVVLTAVIIFGGVKRIATISSSVVPMMALFYLIMAVIILGMHIDMIPTVIANIYKSAFTFQSAAGGMFGALVSKAMMMGIKRGLFSNEAGMGSAPNAAAAAHDKTPRLAKV